MSHDVKQLQRADSPYKHMLSVIDIGKAAHVLNRCISEPIEGVDPPTAQQERVALAVYNKMVPSLQAVSLQVENTTPKTWAEIQGLYLEAGLDIPDPLQVDTIKQVQLESNPE